MKYQGIVIRMTKNKAIVTTDDFECFYIKRSSTFYVGKQIEFAEKEIVRERSVLTKLVLSAACIAILFIIASFSNLSGIIDIKGILTEPKVFAYVDVDINPSLEIEIDDIGNVLRLVPLNEDAKVLVKKFKTVRVSASEAINIIIDEVKRDNAISEDEKDYVLISSTLNNKKNEDDKEYQGEKGKLNILMNSLKNNIEENSKVHVYLAQTSIYDRKDAQSIGISTGRYVLYNKYKNLRSSFSIEEAKSVNVNEFLNGILNYKTEKAIIGSTPESTPSPFIAENTKHNGSATPPGKDISSDADGTVSTKNDLIKGNYTKEPEIKLNTPSPIPSPSPSTKSETINSLFVKFESFNYRGQFIRHKSFKARISPKVIPMDDCLYKIVPGLADPDCISFESKNFPGYFLMHENFKILLKKNDNSKNFKECATFRKVSGLADSNLISFQSYNYPKRYIRHSSYYLQIDEILTELDKKDATYAEVKVE